MNEKAKTRFINQVNAIPLNGCWEWIGSKLPAGYGLFWLDRKYQLAHRVMFFETKGWTNKEVCHHCDNPSCVNPDHLFSATGHENDLDACRKGRKSRKLTREKVIEIRKLHEQGWSNLDIAEKFGITSGPTSMIINRKIWNHV